MIGYFLIEGLFCAAHSGAGAAPAAIIQGNKIVDVSLSARRSGVRPGQTKRQAAFCLQGLQLFEYDEARYGDALNVYLERCYGLTPMIEPCDLRSLFADFGGCPVDREPLKILGSMFDQSDHKDISVYAGLAPSKYLAWSIGQALSDRTLKSASSSESILWLCADEPQVQTVISRIPVKHLWSLDAEVAAELELLGLRTLADVARAGPGNMLRRYGKKGRKMHSCSTGLDRTPVLPLYPPRTIVVQRGFDLVSEAGIEVYEALANLAVEMHARLSAGNQACQRVSLYIQTQTGEQVLARDFQRPIFGAKQLAWALTRLFTSANHQEPGATHIRSLRVEASALCAPSTVQDTLDGDLIPSEGAKYAIDECMAQIEPAMRALEKKYGAALVYSCSDLLREESRRESMLSFWDPVRWRSTNE